MCAFALYLKHTLLNTLPEQTGPSAVFNRYGRRLHHRHVSRSSIICALHVTGCCRWSHAAVPVADDADVGCTGGLGRDRRYRRSQAVRSAAGGPVDPTQRHGQELHAVWPGVRLLDGGGKAPRPGRGSRPSRRLQLHPVRPPRFQLHPVRPGRGVHARRQQDPQTSLRRGRGRAGSEIRQIRRQLCRRSSSRPQSICRRRRRQTLNFNNHHTLLYLLNWNSTIYP